MLTQIGLLLLASCSAPAPEAPIGDGPRASSDSTVVEVPATPSASSGELPTSSTSGPTSPGPGASSAPTGIASTAPTIPPVPPGPAVSVTRSAQKLELSAPIVFEVGGPHLKPESEAVVEAIASFLTKHPEVTLVRIENHTDSDGMDEANLQLSVARAMTVARALVRKRVDCHRLLPVGFGETRPLVPNDSPDNKKKNRRTDLFVAMIEGKPAAKGLVDGGGTVAGNPCQ